MKNPSGMPLTLVGAGNMGGAMLGGWLAQGLDPASILVIDPSPPQWVRSSGVQIAAAAPDGVVAGVLVLAVKPQIIASVLASVSSLAGKDTVAVSVAAGTTLAALEAGLGKGRAVVRTMPNTPALVRRGITVACPNAAVNQRQRARVNKLLLAVGKVEWVDDETLIDAVTAVSGSGPAYVFQLVEALAAAGAKAGLPERLAGVLARETVCGAGELLAQSELTAARLRENVTSPKGTTAAALAVLMDENGLGELMERAVAAAHKRAIELAKG